MADKAKLTKKDDVDAQLKLAEGYIQNKNLKNNMGKAEHYLKQAGAAKSAYAYYKYVDCIQNGLLINATGNMEKILEEAKKNGNANFNEYMSVLDKSTKRKKSYKQMIRDVDRLSEAKMLAPPTLNENGSYSKVLVIDDDETIRVMLEYFLAGAGFKVLQSNTGQAAFETILDQPDIAAIIIDHYMPNMTGLQFVRMMKRLQLLPNAALIMMTGNSEAKFIKEVAKSGVSALLVKPFDKERLFTVLQKSGVSLPLNSKSAA